MIIRQSAYAVGPGVRASFLASGGTAPFAYSLAADGAGGTIDSATGVYTAPAVWNSDPEKRYDTVIAEDADGEEAEAQILIGSPIFLFLEIIQREMGLAANQVHLYQQKFPQPQGPEIQIAVSIVDDRPFANINRPAAEGSGMEQQQMIATRCTLGVNIISGGLAALHRRFDALFALGSEYSQNQQKTNGFKIGRIPLGQTILNLSELEPTRIPYRFYFPVTMFYSIPKNAAIEYYDTFENPEIFTNP